MLIFKKMTLFFLTMWFAVQSHAETPRRSAFKKYTFSLPFTDDNFPPNKKVENPEVTDEEIEYLWQSYSLPGYLEKKEVKKEFKKDVIALTQALGFFSSRFHAPFPLTEIRVDEYFAHFSYDRKTNAHVSVYNGLITINANFHPTNRLNNLKYSREAWLLTLCHEVSHMALINDGALEISEGDTDFRAGSDCFPSLFSNYENAIFVKENDIPDSVVRLCKRRFINPDELNLCFRIISAAKEFTEKQAYYIYNANFARSFKEHMLPKVGQNPVIQLSVETPDRSVRNHYNANDESYPRPQCRLDTFVRAALKMKPPPCFTGRDTNDFELIYGKSN